MGSLGEAEMEGEMEADETRAKLVEEKEMKKEGKTLMVGIRTDSRSRELLTWALVNVAVTGDRVVAVHVLRLSSSSAADLDLYVEELEPMRKAYEGFCSLRQIDLVIKVCRGFSVRRTLVRQVRSYSAAHLILGEAKSSRAIRSSLTSIPKYCSKRLRPECSVVAVNNGKIVFGRGILGIREQGQHSSLKIMGGDPFHCLLVEKSQEGIISDDNTPSLGSSDTFSVDVLSCRSDNVHDDNLQAVIIDKCSVCGTVSLPQCPAEEMVDESQNSPKSGSSAISTIVFSKKQETSTEEVIKPSWSFLRQSIITHRRTNSIDGSTTSLLKWAKRISSRSLASSPIDYIRRHRRSDTFAAANLHKGFGLSPFDDEQVNLRMKLESLQKKCVSFCKLFSHKELVQATCNFSPDRLIGQGGSSQVYKGTLADGKELAVKILKSSKDTLEVFLQEIDMITTLSHKNVISLLGFCFEENNLMLIYELLSRGSLEENLHGPEEQRCALNWSDRYKVAMGLAEALNYLHGDEDAEAVIHMDVKSSNILLSEDFEAKLSDFGLATRSTTSVSQISLKGLAGTFGYLAPECFMFGQVSTKTDVYAFGVVLLELISGRKAINTGGIRSGQSLVMWAKLKLQSGKALELVDPSLECIYDDQMDRTILAASLCLKKDSRSRPSMAYVLKLLHGAEDTLKWARSQIQVPENSSEMVDGDAYLSPDIKSLHNLVMLDIEDDSPSATDSATDATSVEDFLQGRWSRSSSLE